MRLGNVHGVVVVYRDFGVGGGVHVLNYGLGFLLHPVNDLNGHGILMTLGERGHRLREVNLGRLKGVTR